MSQQINLGYHTAELDEQSGVLTFYDTAQRMSLSAHETYNLLVWLNDNYHDTLRTFAQTEQGQRPGFDAPDLPEKAHEDWANEE
jgi:hypothetical protein